ncbi:MAG: sugar phosphate nucleotidyltransferase, partial [Candidatus Acidiferrales bacterium]
ATAEHTGDAGSSVPATRELVEICDATGGCGAIHVERVPRERLHFYGIIDAEQVKAPGGAKESTWHERLLQVKNLVEKPSADKAPSDLGITGRYVLPPEIFDYLAETKPGSGGEIQLTDGLCRLASEGKLYATVFQGRTHDAGDKLGFLQATVEIGLQDPKLGKDFREYLRKLKL